MRILVIDDQLKKFLLIQRVIRAIHPEAEFLHCGTSNAARAVLKSYKFDYIFVDMSFNINSNPSEEAAWESLAGLRVLQTIFRMRVDGKAIVFTAHSKDYKDPHNTDIKTLEELRRHVIEYFPGLCIGCVYSKQSEQDLVAEIRELLK